MRFAQPINKVHPSAAINALPYEAAFEVREEDEAQTTAALIETMTKIQQTVFEHSGHAQRSVHAKSHGILRGELRVLEGLPTMLAQGLFASADTYPVLLRLSTLPGDMLDDNVSTPRGLAIKVLHVIGERLPGSEDDVTQDFVLANGPAFSKPNAKSFLNSLKMLAATTDKAPGLTKVLSSVMQGTEKVVEALGGKSTTLISLGGHPETHPLGETYYSGAPMLYGEYMVKLAVVPASNELKALTKAPVELDGKPNGLREAVVDFFSVHGGEWDVCIQLCTNLESMPIEDASKVWPEEESPYQRVARISVSPQVGWSHARSAAVDDGLSFSPWHGLAAHRPLGSVMRVRKATYQVASQFRARHNNRKIEEPLSLDGLPD